MSAYTDFMEEQFFGEMARLRFEIDEEEEWLKKYVTARRAYPLWKTKLGGEIRLEDMTDSHIENALRLVLERDSENGWVKAFQQEKTYRELINKLPEKKEELRSLQETADIVF